MPTTLQANELLLDSEASLRLVDTVLAEIGEPAPPAAPAIAVAEGLAALPQVLLRAYGEINNALTALRQSRGTLEQSTVEKLQLTNEKLREVSSATEVAATDIMDGIDRAIAMVDELETPADPERHAEIRNSLRDELFGVMGHLQFQDITTQQLSHASSTLVEMEARLVQLARMFDPSQLGLEGPVETHVEALGVAYDPYATVNGADSRQAVADAIFA
ncbi:hypothetical protein [Longimicrobium sp.]|uniref:hypothetical protein n=1 Tax=Longimicrobium sp. TaxID=2029185 RepID=UPI002E2EDFA6|nr:hypothetical protein [Longimicrobium sp.]HEX6037817.1 hypothetical protein [Longimicrobium sp.]